MMTDPIADLLTRLRNAQSARHDTTSMPYSRVKENILRVLGDAGYVQACEAIGDGARKQLVVTLKYTDENEPIILGLKRVSSPGRRVYRGYDDLGNLKPGLGFTIISTPQGVMTDEKARESRVGGEVLFQVW